MGRSNGRKGSLSPRSNTKSTLTHTQSPRFLTRLVFDSTLPLIWLFVRLSQSITSDSHSLSRARKKKRAKIATPLFFLNFSAKKNPNPQCPIFVSRVCYSSSRGISTHPTAKPVGSYASDSVAVGNVPTILMLACGLPEMGGILHPPPPRRRKGHGDVVTWLLL